MNGAREPRERTATAAELADERARHQRARQAAPAPQTADVPAGQDGSEDDGGEDTPGRWQLQERDQQARRAAEIIESAGQPSQWPRHRRDRHGLRLVASAGRIHP